MIGTNDFEYIYVEYKQRFIVIANAYIQNKALAEDLVTDSFMYFWENRETIRIEPSEAPAYILTTVRHKCIDALRERQLKLRTQQNIYQRACRDIQVNLETLEECDLAKVLFSNEIEMIFRKSLADMPEQSAQVFIAHRFEGQTYEEIARHYNLTVRQVTRRMQYCLKILRDDLGDYLPTSTIFLLLPYIWHK